MPAYTVIAFLLCTGVCLAGAHLSSGQEATSANLPDQFQTGEMMQIHKPKKKKSEPSYQTLATATKQDAAPVPEHLPAPGEEVSTQVARAEEKKIEPNRNTASVPPSQRAATPTEQPPSTEEAAVIAVPAEKKPRPRKRPRPAVQPDAVNISAPVPVSLSVAQSMAIVAPLPDYTYEMKRRN